MLLGFLKGGGLSSSSRAGGRHLRERLLEIDEQRGAWAGVDKTRVVFRKSAKGDS